MPHIGNLLYCSVKDRKMILFVQPVPSSTAKMSQEERPPHQMLYLYIDPQLPDNLKK
uniref:Uncharacterized protein n=1 Tax=Ipomoea trifida TaxID=35884 RepID=Q6JJ65_IPOTF|nr:hypothetical protein [Ipomoea trifida]